MYNFNIMLYVFFCIITRVPYIYILLQLIKCDILDLVNNNLVLSHLTTPLDYLQDSFHNIAERFKM